MRTEERLYTTGEAARVLRIGFTTLKNWIYSGKVEAIKNPAGRWLIPEAEIERLLNRDTEEVDLNVKEGREQQSS